jgi:hypothetical protein
MFVYLSLYDVTMTQFKATSKVEKNAEGEVYIPDFSVFRRNRDTEGQLLSMLRKIQLWYL